MSTNLASIMVGLGYDLSALEKGAPEAFRLINSQTASMSAEMKRSSREGAESLRLIDEALGIHLSRPLTRILTQEFPGFAQGLQSILGVGATGVIAMAGFEFFEKIASSIEKATKAQEALRAATQNVDNVFAQEMAAYKHKDKAVTAAASAVDRLAEAEMKEGAAAAEASSVWSRTLAAVGEVASKATSFSSTASIADIQKRFAEFKQNYDTAALQDSINKTSNASKMLAEEIRIASEEVVRFSHLAATQQWYSPGSGFDKVADSLRRYVSDLQNLQSVQTATVTGVRSNEALERQAAAARALDDLYRSIGESTNKLAPPSDPLVKLSNEISQMRYKAGADLQQLAVQALNATGPLEKLERSLELKAARAALSEYESTLDRVFAKAQADADLAKATTALPSKISATGTAPAFGLTGPAPVLGAGGTAGAQVAAFGADQGAQLKLAAQAYQDILTPADKYRVTQQELSLLLERGLIDQQAYTAAIQKAGEEMGKASEQLDKLLAKTGDINAGIQAFFLQWQQQANTGGSFMFDFLNKGLSGFEDQTVKALTGAKTSWRSFFSELDQMALKFVLNKELQSMFQMFSNSSIGKNLGLGNLFSGLGGGNPAQIANTTAITANTAAVTALTAAMSAGGAAGGGGGGGIIGDLSDSGIGSYASGTDFAPGGLSLVGEEGPELVNLPAGSSVTPNSMLRGAPMFITHIDAKGAEIGVEEKIARALEASSGRMVMRAVTEMAEAQRRSIGRS